MRYYLIAGEASGDLHGANLMKAIKTYDAEAQFRFFGGDLMTEQGTIGNRVKHSSEMAFMGFVEVALNLRTILRNMELAKKDILSWAPDAVILIDFPGFNLKIARFAKDHGMKVFYYISPKVWAWNQKRVLKIKKAVDHMFCILPFEVDFYKSWGMDVDYVGNPLLDAISAFKADKSFVAQYQHEKSAIVALLPGSRKQEISLLLPTMLETAKQFPDFKFIIAGAPNFDLSFYQKFMTDEQYEVVFNNTYNLLNIADAALVASGTATLETALFKVPQVVLYKMNPITIAIGRLIIKVKYISLVNLIMDKAVVKELIQNDANPDEIARELDSMIKDYIYRDKILDDYNVLAEKMGSPGASQKTAALITDYLSRG